MITFEFYRDAKGEWRWRAIAANGKIIAESGEGYQRIGDAEHGAILLIDAKENGATTRIVES